jgi:hypothetical protein
MSMDDYPGGNTPPPGMRGIALDPVDLFGRLLGDLAELTQMAHERFCGTDVSAADADAFMTAVDGILEQINHLISGCFLTLTRPIMGHIGREIIDAHTAKLAARNEDPETRVNRIMQSLTRLGTVVTVDDDGRFIGDDGEEFHP